jgi:serine/threonine-protein kinase
MTAVNESQITTQPDHSVNNNNNNTKPINKPSHNLKFLLIKSAFLITLITIGVMGINIYLQPPIKVVEYAKAGVKFKYPKNWQETPVIDKLTRIIPKNTISSSLTPEFFITIDELFQSESLEDYTKFSIGQIEALGQNAKIIKSGQIQLAETQGYQVVYQFRDNVHKVNFQEMQVWIVNGKKAYILTYRAEDKSYPEFAKTVEETIIKSFKLEKSRSEQSTNSIW